MPARLLDNSNRKIIVIGKFVYPCGEIPWQKMGTPLKFAYKVAVNDLTSFKN